MISVSSLSCPKPFCALFVSLRVATRRSSLAHERPAVGLLNLHFQEHDAAGVSLRTLRGKGDMVVADPDVETVLEVHGRIQELLTLA